MSTLFNTVFGGVNFQLYLTDPKYVHRLLVRNREERGLSLKEVLIRREKEFDEFGDKISALPKSMRGDKHKPFHYQYMFSPDKDDPDKIEMLNDHIELFDKDGNPIKLEKVKITQIDEKNAIPKAVEPKKRTVLHFKNGASVELTKDVTPKMWQNVDSIVIEQWLTKDEISKLYPQVKI